VNNELERVWKEGVMTRYVVSFRYLPRGILKNHKNPQSVRLVCVLAEIQGRNLPNTS